jgi:hypothetical protein
MHQAFCTNRESMHLTVSIVPLTLLDLIGKALRATAETDIELRQRVPWSIESENDGLEDLANQVRNRLIKLANQVDVGAVLRSERSSLQKEPEGGSRGGLASAIASLRESSGSDL